LQAPCCKKTIIYYLTSSNIRPREKSLSLERERDRQARQLSRERSAVTRQPRNNVNGSSRGIRSTSDSTANQPWELPYPLLSRTLTVANLPSHFSPKNLFDLFSEVGKADAAFCYSLPDAKGRRVGEVAMSSFLFAQKVHLSCIYLTLGSRIHGWAIC
jgi:hypothetical protein